MKRTISAIFILAAVLTFVACEKNQQRLIDTSGVEGKALLKLNYAMPHLQTATTAAFVQLKLNGERVGTVGGSTAYAYPFPGGGLNTAGASYADYLSVNPGATTITVSKPNVGTNNDSVVLFTGSVTLDAGKNYTAHLADTGTNATVVLVENNVSLPDSGVSRYTFVNLHPNQPALDLYHGTTKMASNIPYKGTSPEFTIAAGTAGSWTIRPAGAAPTSTALHTYSNTIPNQRVLTVFARGYTGITGIRAPAISLMYNR